MKTLLMLTVMLALLGCTTSEKMIDLSGLRRVFTAGPTGELRSEIELDEEGNPVLDDNGQPVVRSIDLENGTLSSVGADGANNFIVFVISQNDGEVSGATTDAAARIAASLNSPNANTDAGGDNEKKPED